MATASPPTSASLESSIALLGGFTVVVDGDPVDLPNDAKRLVAFLALQSGRVPRHYIAGNLWGNGTQERAFGNLRSALWRLRRITDEVVEADSNSLAINEAVAVDVTTLMDAADRLCRSKAQHTDIDLDPSAFTQELLPGWYDEWAFVHRERLRQHSLHALEALAQCLTECGRFASAIQAALAAIALDSLRESPHRSLIRTYIAEGNYSEAINHYHNYRTHLHTELGITPSPLLEAIIGEVTSSPRCGDAAR